MGISLKLLYKTRTNWYGYSIPEDDSQSCVWANKYSQYMTNTWRFSKDVFLHNHPVGLLIQIYMYANTFIIMWWSLNLLTWNGCRYGITIPSVLVTWPLQLFLSKSRPQRRLITIPKKIRQNIINISSKWRFLTWPHNFISNCVKLFIYCCVNYFFKVTAKHEVLWSCLVAHSCTPRRFDVD